MYSPGARIYATGHLGKYENWYISYEKEIRKTFFSDRKVWRFDASFSHQIMKDAEQEIIKEFSILEDWMEKYDHLIKLGKSMIPMDEKNKIDENLIKGCQSQVWLHSEFIDDKVIFTADSDTTITKGMISMLIRVFSGRTASEILNGNLDFISEIGLMQHISATRSNGLVSMFKQMKSDAQEFI